MDGFGGPGCSLASESFCFNQCSGRGRCNLGFCHCDPGWYGLDCAHAATEEAEAALEAGPAGAGGREGAGGGGEKHAAAGAGGGAGGAAARTQLPWWLQELAFDAWSCSSSGRGCSEDLTRERDGAAARHTQEGPAPMDGHAHAAADLEGDLAVFRGAGGDDGGAPSRGLPRLPPPPPPQRAEEAAPVGAGPAGGQRGEGQGGGDFFSGIAGNWAADSAADGSERRRARRLAAERDGGKERGGSALLDELRRRFRARRLSQEPQAGPERGKGGGGSMAFESGSHQNQAPGGLGDFAGPGRLRPLIYVYNVPSIYVTRMLQYRLYRGVCTWRWFDAEYDNATLTSHYTYGDRGGRGAMAA